MSLHEPSQPVRVVVPDWLINAGAIAWRVLAALALAGVIVLIATELFTVTASALLAVIRRPPSHRSSSGCAIAAGRARRRRRWSPSSRC